MSENERQHLIKANKLARRLQFIIIMALTISYIIMGRKQGISTPILAAMFATLWIPTIASGVVATNHPDSPAVKHIIGLGYGAFYAVVTLFTTQDQAYVYAFPMLLVVTIYCDFKFSLTVSAGVMLIAFTDAILMAVSYGFTNDAIAVTMIEIAAVTLVCLYTNIANKFIIGVNKAQMEMINEANAKTEEMLANIVDVSNALANDVEEVSEKMETLAISSQETYDAMQEVQMGTRETAESVQSQLIKTEEIQQQIDNVSEVSKNIGTNVDLTDAAIKEGVENIKKLMEQAEISGAQGREAVKEVDELKEYTVKMQEIVKMIQGVASQTSMLALNASIEAARAGEAGRGFAVVASQISNLASQTQTATGNISGLIEGVTGKMSTVADAISSLVESNISQNESAAVSAESFDKIVANASEIRTGSDELSNVVVKLDVANKQIIDSIQTISGISEEVSAHSDNTCSSTEKNSEIVKDVQDIVVRMNDSAEKLKNA